MAYHVRPTCGTWAVFHPTDGTHAEILFRGNKEQCETFAEAAEKMSDLLEEEHNAFSDWLTDGKKGGAAQMLTAYAK